MLDTPKPVIMPTTLAEWWDYIQTESTPLKINYFLRNESAIRSTCKVPHKAATRWTDWAEYLAFLSRHAAMKTHGTSTPDHTNYSLRELPGDGQFEFLFSITRGTRGLELRRTSSVMRSPIKEWINVPQ